MSTETLHEMYRRHDDAMTEIRTRISEAQGRHDGMRQARDAIAELLGETGAANLLNSLVEDAWRDYMNLSDESCAMYVRHRAEERALHARQEAGR